jgi:hypothetical protein
MRFGKLEKGGVFHVVIGMEADLWVNAMRRVSEVALLTLDGRTWFTAGTTLAVLRSSPSCSTLKLDTPILLFRRYTIRT